MKEAELDHGNLLTKLEEAGWCLFSNQTEEQLNVLLKLLGQVILTTDVIVKTDSKAMVTSARGLDFHTDHHKANYITWYCYKQTDIGGESILLDAKRIYLQLSRESQERLKTIDLFEHKIFADDVESFPLVTEDENGKNRFYYSFWFVKNEDKQNPALLEFQTIIKKTEPIKLKLKKGDILIIDNHRIFHGRTPIEGSKDRFLKRFWVASHNS